jgi:hypothetical protein
LDEKIFRLGAVDRVPEPPTAERFHAFAMAALRPLSRQTGAALTAWSDGTGHDAIADLVTSDSFAQFLDYPDRFVSDYQPGFHRIFATHDVEIGPQIVVSVMRITASPTPGRGRRTSSMPILSEPRKTLARIVGG